MSAITRTHVTCFALVDSSLIRSTVISDGSVQTVFGSPLEPSVRVYTVHAVDSAASAAALTEGAEVGTRLVVPASIMAGRKAETLRQLITRNPWKASPEKVAAVLKSIKA